jgi:hypothetical protein
MATGRKLVSDVRSMHKLLSTDNSVTDRAIFSEIRNNTSLLVKRETNLRKLWATDTLFTTIPCIELIEVPLTECCGYNSQLTVSRTKFKIPLISEGNYQYVIQGVYSINILGGNGTKLKEITVNRYVNMLKLNILKQETYYWITNGYLYTNNPDLIALRLVAYFSEDVSNDIMFSDCGCGKEYSSEEYCKNPLDKPFAIPTYLEKQVLDLTSQRLLSTYFRIKTDMADNGIDGQAPNSSNNV